jgi:hypothetical protein
VRVVVRYSPASLTAQQYYEAYRRVEQTLSWPPEGLDLHLCFGSEGSFRVTEIWDSREEYEAFGESLMPLLAEMGIELCSEPEVSEVPPIEKR